MTKKPNKKQDFELWELINRKIDRSEYIFLRHAIDRKRERNINDLTVINILQNKGQANRKRNKMKDKYETGYIDWNYCIEGTDHDNKKIRIIISFDNEQMLIITVIDLKEGFRE